MALIVHDLELDPDDPRRKVPTDYEIPEAIYQLILEKHSRLALVAYPEIVETFKAAREGKTPELTLLYARACVELAEKIGRTVVVAEFTEREKVLKKNLERGQTPTESLWLLTAVPGAGLGRHPGKAEWRELASSPDVTHWEVDWMRHHPPMRLKDIQNPTT